MKKTNTKKRFKKAFIKEGNDIFVVDNAYFDQIKDRAEAENLAVQAYLELNTILVNDAIAGSDEYISTMKISTGLKRSLLILEEKFPKVLDTIQAVDRRINGIRLGKC